MNRILQNNDGRYQVLITPKYTSNPSMEMILGNFFDEKLMGYSIANFDTLQDAMDVAFAYPPIDWNKLVNMHIDSFQDITKIIKNTLSNGNFIVEIDSHLMDPTELKETMFRRIKNNGNRFSLFYDANDIISINIINPWTRNIVEIANTLKFSPKLNIKKIIHFKTHISLIGVTSVDTVYEIRLWTTIMSQWVRWIHRNNLNPTLYENMIPQLINKQKIVDDGDIIR